MKPIRLSVYCGRCRDWWSTWLPMRCPLRPGHMVLWVSSSAKPMQLKSSNYWWNRKEADGDPAEPNIGRHSRRCRDFFQVSDHLSSRQISVHQFVLKLIKFQRIDLIWLIDWFDWSNFSGSMREGSWPKHAGKSSVMRFTWRGWYGFAKFVTFVKFAKFAMFF